MSHKTQLSQLKITHIIRFSAGQCGSASLHISTETQYSIFYWTVEYSPIFPWYKRLWQWSGTRPLLAVWTLGADNAPLLQSWSTTGTRSFVTAFKLLATFGGPTELSENEVGCVFDGCAVFLPQSVASDFHFPWGPLWCLLTAGQICWHLSAPALPRHPGQGRGLAASPTLSCRANLLLETHTHHLHINGVKGNQVKGGKYFVFPQLFDAEKVFLVLMRGPKVTFSYPHK